MHYSGSDVGQHVGALNCIVAWQPEGFEHGVRLGPFCVEFVFSSFLPQLRGMYVNCWFYINCRYDSDSAWVFVCLCGPVMDWRVVQSVPFLPPSASTLHRIKLMGGCSDASASLYVFQYIWINKCISTKCSVRPCISMNSDTITFIHFIPNIGYGCPSLLLIKK